MNIYTVTLNLNPRTKCFHNPTHTAQISQKQRNLPSSRLRQLIHFTNKFPRLSFPNVSKQCILNFLVIQDLNLIYNNQVGFNFQNKHLRL